MHRSCALLALTLIAVSLPSFAIEDNEENRRAQFERYLAAMPVRDLLTDMTEHVAKTLPLEEQALLKKVMNEYVDIDLLNETMGDAMVRNFTADEIAALADFYASPIARSAMDKMGIYMAEVMPVVQREMERAVAEARRDQQEPDAEEAAR